MKTGRIFANPDSSTVLSRIPRPAKAKIREVTMRNSRLEALLATILADTRSEFGSDLISVMLTGSALFLPFDYVNDVDICILTRTPLIQRRRRLIDDIKCDFFIDPIERIREVITKRQTRFLIWMYSNCEILADSNGQLASLIIQASHAWTLGRATPDEGEVFRYTYEIHDILDNILQSDDIVTVAYLVSMLVPRLVDAFWLQNQMWGVHRKRAMKSIAQSDPRFYADLVKLLDASHEIDERKRISIQVVRYVFKNTMLSKIDFNRDGPVMQWLA